MAESFIQLPPPGTGSKVRSFQVVVGANTVEHQGLVLCDSAGNILDVLAAAPAGTERGLAVRQVGAVSTNASITAGLPDATATGALGALNAAVQVGVAGYGGASYSLAAGTLIGTLQPQFSLDGGTTWSQAWTFNAGTGAVSTSPVFGTANTAVAWSFVPVPGATHYRVTVTAWTSGTANITLRATAMGGQPMRVNAATGTASSVASTITTNTTILAANNNRKGASIYNESTSVLFILAAGGTESATNYSTQIQPGGYYELPFPYTGAITGHWAAANGSARVTEYV